MRKGWEIKRLGDVCLKITDGSHNPPKGIEISEYLMLSSRDIYDEQIHYNNPRFLSKKDFENEDKRTAIKAKDVLLTIVGTIGRVAVVPNIYPKFTLQRSVAVLRPNINEIDPYFLKFLLQNSLNFLISESRGAAQKGIYLNQLKQIQISLPLLSEQREIVSILDDAFESIERAKSNAEENLKNAKELFESYLNNIFQFKGEGWEEKRLVEVCELKSGTTIDAKLEKNSGDIIYAKIGDMNLEGNEVYITKSSRYVSLENIKQNQIIPLGSIIFPKRGGAIATNKKRRIIKPTIVDLNTMALVPYKFINSDYLFHWFKQINLIKLSNGTSIPQINNYSFDNVFITYPTSLSKQKEIVDKLDTLLAETNKLESIYQQKLNDLEELKKSILQKAFNGELKTSKKSA